MTDAVITVVLTELASLLKRQITEQINLVVGVDKDIQKLTGTFEAIKAVLLDAERRQVKEEAVRLWVEKLKDVTYDMDDVLCEWTTAILKIEMERQLEGASSSSFTKTKVYSVFRFPCFCFKRVGLRRDIALKIKEINESLDLIASEKIKYGFNTIMPSEAPATIKTTSYIVVSEVRGRDKDKSTLVDKLLPEGGDHSSSGCGIRVISIVGMGGIGKTTLAQLAYSEVKPKFDIQVWVCVGEPFDNLRVAKAILEDLEGSAPNLFELETVLRRLRTIIEGKKVLLVLDDVWNEDHRQWEPLRASLNISAAGSRILVTTRKETVAKVMRSSYNLPLGLLSDDDCWSLFSKIAFSTEGGKEKSEELKRVGRKISDKCKGLPLAAKTIASLMQFKNSMEDWANVLDNEMWEVKEGERGVFAPLLLSYYDLPSALKRCFSYCANFPKDYKIEADNLIKLWMAHGYLNTKGNVEIEKTGEEYLENLIMRSFFQEVERDKDSSKAVRFKMHDMVHDFAQYLTKNECITIEVQNDIARKLESSFKKPRHLTLVRPEDVCFPGSIGEMGKLHSFWVQSFYDCPPLLSGVHKVSSDLFSCFACLKSLDLSRNRLCELPEAVEGLTNLRYLNLSHNPLSELPETLCGLCNLQTLKLVACDHLRKLPQGIGRLINLRHLEIDRTDSLKVLPKGIGRLSSLRTLSKYIIVSSAGNEQVCKLEDLKDLNHLRGYLKIEGLGHVTDVDEAVRAELKNKEHVSDLYMNFSPSVLTDGTNDLVEALQLNPKLQCLQFSCYGGTKFPDWMISLVNLRKLTLINCENCSHLPPLGRLPLLETLCIESMHNVKYVGIEFLGSVADKNHTNTRTEVEEAAPLSAISSFPKLKKLKIAYMRNWEKWDLAEAGSGKVMPCLRYLKLSYCSKLKELPDFLLHSVPIKKLRIDNCMILQQQYQKETGENWSKISHIQKVRVSRIMEI